MNLISRCNTNSTAKVTDSRYSLARSKVVDSQTWFIFTLFCRIASHWSSRAIWGFLINVCEGEIMGETAET